MKKLSWDLTIAICDMSSTANYKDLEDLQNFVMEFLMSFCDPYVTVSIKPHFEDEGEAKQ